MVHRLLEHLELQLKGDCVAEFNIRNKFHI